ncbi:MAG TPA: alpha/beta fold hydrolase [Fimbriimonas sp.]|nr:alpha/beta fold hydrolase [Fimbriimonas sp.]
MIYVLLGVLALYLGACYRLALAYIHPDRLTVTCPPTLTTVLMPSRYGPTPSWETHGLASGRPSKVVFVLVHGYGGSRESWSTVMTDLFSKGFDSVAPSMPGQDASPAKSVGFGISESHTIVDAVKWVRSVAPASKVIVFGMSMGGGATWIATKEDPTIDGVVTDSAFARFDEAMNCFFDRKLPLGHIFLSPVVTIASWMTKLDPSTVRPVDEAKLWHGKPALIIQGGADTLVTPDQGERLAEAAGCPMWTVSGAEHVQSYSEQPVAYLEHLVAFAHSLEGRSRH